MAGIVAIMYFIRVNPIRESQLNKFVYPFPEFINSITPITISSTTTSNWVYSEKIENTILIDKQTNNQIYETSQIISVTEQNALNFVSNTVLHLINKSIDVNSNYSDTQILVDIPFLSEI